MSKNSEDTDHKSQGNLEPNEGDTCFVIMPFGDWFNKYYRDIYQPAVQSLGLVPKRADDLYRPGTIVNDIWNYTQEAKLILADLTGRNPNVFYELGLAHAIAKPAVLVAESINDVPFDLRHLRIIEYEKDEPDWGNILKKKIEKAIQEIFEAPERAILPTFLEVIDNQNSTTFTPMEKDILEIHQRLDSLQTRHYDMDLQRLELKMEHLDDQVDQIIKLGCDRSPSEPSGRYEHLDSLWYIDRFDEFSIRI